jgi:hypothetical protein
MTQASDTSAGTGAGTSPPKADATPLEEKPKRPSSDAKPLQDSTGSMRDTCLFTIVFHVPVGSDTLPLFVFVLYLVFRNRKQYEIFGRGKIGRFNQEKGPSW